jgi:N-methylhydantoinase B
MPPKTPACAGTFRPIAIRAPQGSLLSSQRPEAVAAGTVETITRGVDLAPGDRLRIESPGGGGWGRTEE